MSPALTPAASCGRALRTTQWLTAANAAAKHCGCVVCFVDGDYLDSNSCCDEYNAARDKKIAIVVVLEPLAVLKAKEPRDRNGPLLFHLVGNGQCLLAFPGAEFSDPEVLADFLFQQLCIKVRSDAARCVQLAQCEPKRSDGAIHLLHAMIS